jgi:hypothetical protein
VWIRSCFACVRRTMPDHLVFKDTFYVHIDHFTQEVEPDKQTYAVRVSLTAPLQTNYPQYDASNSQVPLSDVVLYYCDTNDQDSCLSNLSLLMVVSAAIRTAPFVSCCLGTNYQLYIACLC